MVHPDKRIVRQVRITDVPHPTTAEGDLIMGLDKDGRIVDCWYEDATNVLRRQPEENSALGRGLDQVSLPFTTPGYDFFEEDATDVLRRQPEGPYSVGTINVGDGCCVGDDREDVFGPRLEGNYYVGERCSVG